MSKLPIGVFDSGLGGLTAFEELKKLMPKENLIYFGDNARVPYGTKSESVIKKFALQDTRFLLSKNVKAILIACGTVSSTCLADVKNASGVPVVGVVEAAAEKAVSFAEKNGGPIVVLGTNATVKSGAYEKAVKKYGDYKIIARACPLFVPLVENGKTDKDDIAVNAITKEYLCGIEEENPSAVILGCTHYPLLAEAIKKYVGKAELVSAGKEAAIKLSEEIISLGLASDGVGKAEYYTSDNAALFSENAAKFFGFSGECENVDIERF